MFGVPCTGHTAPLDSVAKIPKTGSSHSVTVNSSMTPCVEWIRNEACDQVFSARARHDQHALPDRVGEFAERSRSAENSLRNYLHEVLDVRVQIFMPKLNIPVNVMHDDELRRTNQNLPKSRCWLRLIDQVKTRFPSIFQLPAFHKLLLQGSS